MAAPSVAEAPEPRQPVRSAPFEAARAARSDGGTTSPLDVTYVLPIRSATPVDDLDGYLNGLAAYVDVIVVDGSSPEVFAEHRRRWSTRVRHQPVDSDLVTPMGKVGGVLTGVRHARHRVVVIADDDVRWDREQIERAVERLAGAAVVRPQNVYQPAPWSARWDTGRILLNRRFGGDWPGTLVIDRDALVRVGGYNGVVMFENLELVRTLRAGGGTEKLALDIMVTRRPATTRRFWQQRVREAYDEVARPWRLAAGLTVIPAVVVGGRWAVLAVAVAAVAGAEAGRRRAGGTAVYPSTSALWAPVWVGERAITSWLAVGSRVLYGGVHYRGVVLRDAATPLAELRRRPAAAGVLAARQATPRP